MHSRHVAATTGVLLALVLVAGCGSSRPRQSAPKKSTSKAGSASKLNLPDLVAKVRSGVIQIEATTCQGGVEGTGFLLDSRHIATVEHVIDGETTITLKRSGRVLGTATVIGADTSRDLALLATSTPIQGYYFAISRRAPRLAEEVAALGFPLGLPLSVTRGVVSGSDRTIPINGINRKKLVQTDAAVNPGNSGGPLIATGTGEVVGLVDLGTDQANGLAFAVSGLVAKPLLDAWQGAPQQIAASSCLSPPPPPPAPPPPPPPPSPSQPPISLPGPSGRLYAITHDVVIYDGPSTTANAVGSISAGTMVGVQCKVSGETINGPFGPDSNWDEVSFDNGVTGFVTDEWVDTKNDEHDPSKVPVC
jgi:Trypsin-like peptidase domain